jgi:branched-chain amino acid transport system ATP-binding protein
MKPLLEVQGLCAGYGQQQVLHGLDFTVDEGEVVVVLGANGAGKTTTLRALSAMIPWRGMMRFAGRELTGGLRPDQMARRGVAHVPQGRGTFTDLTVEENLRLGAYTRSHATGVMADLSRWFEVFPTLAQRRHQAAGSMSGGEQQMLALARALMSRPRLLLLDEPSLGLAPKVTRELFVQLGNLNAHDGTTMLIVEQNARLALDFATRAYVLETGLIVSAGRAADLRNDESLRRAYLGY